MGKIFAAASLAAVAPAGMAMHQEAAKPGVHAAAAVAVDCSAADILAGLCTADDLSWS
ncbi:hypothetical protein [Dyella acidiphila]|uniref:Uncharacterized protein n=1 Tax=Dyella acidiphila TaxID=2775866 RepID=A0ABR9G751_9GAMM|nr:hypothetical protein [Dyella acidiphila]MBE1159878.1 hypothetical protein [Dyella acidiphila]